MSRCGPDAVSLGLMIAFFAVATLDDAGWDVFKKMSQESVASAVDEERRAVDQAVQTFNATNATAAP